MYLSPRERSRKRFITRLKIYGVLLLIGLVIEGAAWLIIWLPPLHIKKITVTGVSPVEGAAIIHEIAARYISPYRAGIFDFDHILSWPSGDVTLQYSGLERTTVRKDLLHRTLNIVVQPREPYGQWCTPKTCYLFDLSGIIFTPMHDTQTATAIIITADNLAHTLISPHLIIAIKYLKENFSNIKKIEWHGEDLELTAYFAAGPTLYFDTRFDSTANLRALTELRHRPIFSKLSYVDLRVENRLFYK